MNQGFQKQNPALYREALYWQRAILEILSWKPLTVPELAEVLKLSPPEVMMHLNVLRRCGFIEEAPKSRRERYYRYRLKE